MMSLLADAAVLLRALALLRQPACPLPLGQLTPWQLSLDVARCGNSWNGRSDVACQ
jgi:hypothetical protein